MHVAVVGGGITGLVAAYELSKAGAKVTLLERSARLGGLAASFPIDGSHDIEKYYHFICKPDHAYFDMMGELAIADRLRWVTTRMGLWYHGELRPLGDPLSVLAFPYLSIADKARFGLATLRAKLSTMDGWRSIENVAVRDWLVSQYGEQAYNILYRPLLEQKFRHNMSQISAAWMWARFHRLGNSRTLTQQERIGYLDGGTQSFVDALEAADRKLGVDIRLHASVQSISTQDGNAVAAVDGAGLMHFDQILCTAPLPYTRQMFGRDDLPYFKMINALEYIGVMVMVLRLDRRFSPYFWMNVSDPRLDIAGVIEYTNLNPCSYLGGDAILYIPQYLPADHALFTMSDADLFKMYCSYLATIRPEFTPDWVKGHWVFRDRFAQPLCDLGFSQHTPGMETPLRNVYLTDSCQLHPDDRTISNSTDLGKKAAQLMLRNASQ